MHLTIWLTVILRRLRSTLIEVLPWLALQVFFQIFLKISDKYNFKKVESACLQGVSFGQIVNCALDSFELGSHLLLAVQMGFETVSDLHHM